MLDNFHTALGLGLANAAAQASHEKELLALEQRWAAALVLRDTATLDAILAEDFQIIWIDGSALGKAEVLAGTAGRQADVEPFATEDVQVRLYGHVAVTSGRATLKLKLRGQVELCHIRYTDVFTRAGEGWQAVSAQVTLVCPPKSFFEQAGAEKERGELAVPPSQLVGQFFLLGDDAVS